MFNSINFKKKARTSFLAILMTGTLIVQPGISSNNSNVNNANNNNSSDSNDTKDVVSVELVLSVDVSTSIDRTEFELQRNGYIAAFQDSEVQEAIKNLPDGLAVNMQFWASENVVDIGWYKLIDDGNGGISNLQEFINKIDSVRRTGKKGENGENIANNRKKLVTIDGNTTYMGGGTDITLAINEAQKLLLENNYDGQALVIDVSGDGVSKNTPYSGEGNQNGFCPQAHFCPPLEAARDAAVAAGITINGLPIVNNQNTAQLTHEIDFYYQQLVIGGNGAFVEVANDFSGFTTAAKNKILREIIEADDRLTDTDGDGINDADEGKAENLDSDGDGTPNYQDDDSDDDGILDRDDPDPYLVSYAD